MQYRADQSTQTRQSFYYQALFPAAVTTPGCFKQRRPRKAA